LGFQRADVEIFRHTYFLSPKISRVEMNRWTASILWDTYDSIVSHKTPRSAVYIDSP